MGDQNVLVSFPVSTFGWMPVVMPSDVWEEIYEAYTDQVIAELDDDNGSAIEVDLCDSVKNAVVTPNPSDDLILWSYGLDTQHFFNYVCLQRHLESWGLHIELNRVVGPLFAERGGECSPPKAIALNTVQVIGTLGSKTEVIVTLKLIDTVTECTLTFEDGQDIVLGVDYLKALVLALDGVKPEEVVVGEINVRETLSDKTKDLDLSAFDNIIVEPSK